LTDFTASFDPLLKYPSIPTSAKGVKNKMSKALPNQPLITLRKDSISIPIFYLPEILTEKQQ
jgi:hypothetical protein